MDERVLQFRVGVVMLAAIVLASILVMLFDAVPSLPMLSEKQYDVPVYFPGGAPGVAKGTPVRKSGILIGRVTDVAFAEQQRGVIVHAGVYSENKVFQDELCRVRGELLGDVNLEFVTGAQIPAERLLIEPGQQIEGQVVSGPMDVIASLEVTLTEAVQSVKKTSEDISTLTAQVSAILGDNGDQIKRVIAKTELTLDALRTTMEHADGLIGDPQLQANLRHAVERLPEVLKSAEDALGDLGLLAGAAQRNLENLEGFTAPLGERGPALVDNMDRSIAQLGQLVEELVQFSRMLNNPDGSLNRLVNDPDLYHHLLSAAENVDELTGELRPIIDNVRVFTDKIARRPNRLIMPDNGAK
jgi:phospholipid/cholesterol/gamma-HCH transport system substrate-binding protein